MYFAICDIQNRKNAPPFNYKKEEVPDYFELITMKLNH
jgi:hypothetical protein